MNYNKTFSKIGFNYLILAIAALIFQAIFVNLINYYNPNLVNDINIITVISAVCNYILPLPIIYYLMKRLESGQITKEKVGIKRFIIYICVTMLLMWIGNIIGLIITAGIGFVTNSPIANPVQELISSSDILMNLLVISIVAPIFEELFFRKFLIDRTIKYGAKVSIVTSAILFAFFHGNLNQFFYAFLMGGFFAYVYIKSGKIQYTITLHLIVNLMGSVVSLIFADSLEALINGASTNMDMAVILAYLIFVLAALLIGIIAILLNYKKIGSIDDNSPMKLKEIILNPGMLVFLAFFVGEIILSIVR